MTTIDRKQAADSAAHWRSLARDEINMAEYEASRGHDVSSFFFRAETYNRTAEALEKEAATGLPHCTMCLGQHPNHLHAHRG